MPDKKYEEKFFTDPVFHAFVKTIENGILHQKMTPEDFRQAILIAEERILISHFCTKCMDKESSTDRLLFGNHFCENGVRIPPERVVIDLDGTYSKVPF